MTQTRFIGCIHSIVGHIMMISPHGDPATQERCFIDDFVSIMPVKSEGTVVRFCFNVVPDRIPAMPYHKWLGNEQFEKNELSQIHDILGSLTDSVNTLLYAQHSQKGNVKIRGEDVGLDEFDPEPIDDPNLPTSMSVLQGLYGKPIA